MTYFELRNLVVHNGDSPLVPTHLPPGCDNLVTVSLDLARSGPMEIRHLELFRNINFDENKTWKGLQIVAQISDQKLKKKDKIA